MNEKKIRGLSATDNVIDEVDKLDEETAKDLGLVINPGSPDLTKMELDRLSDEELAGIVDNAIKENIPAFSNRILPKHPPSQRKHLAWIKKQIRTAKKTSRMRKVKRDPVKIKAARKAARKSRKRNR